MKAIMISIKPEWVAKILNGEKTIEIRKTMPKCELPIKCYIYCTKDKNNLLYGSPYFNGSWKVWKDKKSIKDIALVKGWDAKTGAVYSCDLANGKVVVEFTLNRIGMISFFSNGRCVPIDFEDKKTCLTEKEMREYLKGNTGYAWYIDNLKIYDSPKELREFSKHGFKNLYGSGVCGNSSCPFYLDSNTYDLPPECLREDQCQIIRPPQSWCYVEEVKDER